jgi:hypothetical protein
LFRSRSLLAAFHSLNTRFISARRSSLDRLATSCGAGFELWRSGGPRRASFLSAWRQSKRPQPSHFTATAVRVGVFVDGVRNSLKSIPSRTGAGALGFGPRSCPCSPECVEGECSDVGLPLYGVLRSLPNPHSQKFNIAPSRYLEH